MKDLNKIQEFFSKSLEEMAPAVDEATGSYLSGFPSKEKPPVEDYKEEELAQYKEELRALIGKYKSDFKDKNFIIGVAQIMNNWKPLLRSQLAIEENQTESKYKKGDKITYYGNKGVVNSAKWNSMAKDWEYYVTYYKDDVRRSDNGINDRELKPLEENILSPEDFPSNFKQGDTVYVFDRIKGDRAMYYNPMIKGDRVVFKSRKEMDSLLDESVVPEVKEEDKVDIVTMDVPLFIRALEYAKEDAQEDMDLHDFAERAITGTKEQGVLSMDDYDMLVGGKEPMDESVVTEVKVGDKVKINKEYGGGKGTIEDIVGSFVVVNGKSYHESDVEKMGLDEEKGYSPQLVTPENPKGKTKGLTPDVMNKILMKIIQDLDESSPGLWDNIRAKRERGEKPARKGSKAYKTAVKAGRKINKAKN